MSQVFPQERNMLDLVLRSFGLEQVSVERSWVQEGSSWVMVPGLYRLESKKNMSAEHRMTLVGSLQTNSIIHSLFTLTYSLNFQRHLYQRQAASWGILVLGMLEILVHKLAGCLPDQEIHNLIQVLHMKERDLQLIFVIHKVLGDHMKGKEVVHHKIELVLHRKAQVHHMTGLVHHMNHS